jgi:hypothetical protein
MAAQNTTIHRAESSITGHDMSKADNYIKRQTARNTLSSIKKDVEKLGNDSGRQDQAADIVERLEHVRKGLIGT